MTLGQAKIRVTYPNHLFILEPNLTFLVVLKLQSLHQPPSTAVQRRESRAHKGSTAITDKLINQLVIFVVF